METEKKVTLILHFHYFCQIRFSSFCFGSTQCLFLLILMTSWLTIQTMFCFYRFQSSNTYSPIYDMVSSSTWNLNHSYFMKPYMSVWSANVFTSSDSSSTFFFCYKSINSLDTDFWKSSAVTVLVTSCVGVTSHTTTSYSHSSFTNEGLPFLYLIIPFLTSIWFFLCFL